MRAKVPLLVTLATPFRGAHISEIAAKFLPNPALRDLHTPGYGSSLLLSLDSRTRYMRGTAKPRTRIECAYETASIVPGAPRIVTWESGTGQCDGQPVAINDDHLGISAPDGPDHGTVDFVRSRLKKQADPTEGLMVALKRDVDYRGSVCVDGRRTFRQVITDELTFSDEGDIYSLWACVLPGMEVVVSDLSKTGSTEIAQISTGHPECTGEAYDYSSAVHVVDRIGKVQWTWSSENAKIEGEGVSVRYPLTDLELAIRLPQGVDFKGVKIEPPDIECSGKTDSAGIHNFRCSHKHGKPWKGILKLSYEGLRGLACG